MKIVAATLVLASTVAAQDLGALPDCAKNCLTEYTAGDKIGDCGRLDAKCICASKSFITGIACCLADVCDADAQRQAVDYARSFCSTQGVTDLPPSVTCASTSGTSAPTTSTPTTEPTSTSQEAATATPNAGPPVGSSSLGAKFYGSLLAALAIL